MNLTKIIYDGPEKNLFRFKFLWNMTAGDAQSDGDYILLYKVLDDCEISSPPSLTPDTPGVNTAEIYSPGSTAEKAGARKLSVPEDSICAFAVCPKTDDEIGAASNTALSYVGIKKKVVWSLKGESDGCTELTVSAECDLGPEDLFLKINGQEYPLPFNVGRQEQRALFFAQISANQAELLLRGKALYKCIVEKR